MFVKPSLIDRLMNGTAFLLSMAKEGEDDNAGGGGSKTPEGDAPKEGGDAEGAQDQDEQPGGDEGAEGEGDDEGDEGEDDGGDDLADLEGLTPEQKARVQAKIDKRIAKETTWRDRQIERLYSKRRAAEAAAEDAAAIAQGRKPAGDAPQNLTAEQIRAEARKITAQEKYDEDCNATDAAGRKAFGDKWKQAVDKLPKMGGVEVTDMVNILATDNPAMVLYSLANDPDLYDDIMSLPPARRVTEFVKLGMKPLPKTGKTVESKRPSGATPPVNPINGSRRAANTGQVNLYDDKVDDDAWYQHRNATRARKFSNAQ